MKKYLLAGLVPIGLALFIMSTARQALSGRAAGNTTALISLSTLLDRNAALQQGFTYQGVLKDSSGSPINSTCNFTFRLWDAMATGSQVGADSQVTGINVINGYFTALVNAAGEFGSTAFSGDERWLEVSLQCTVCVLRPIRRDAQPLGRKLEWQWHRARSLGRDHWGKGQWKRFRRLW
jgi:hypothetical protein